MLAGASSASMAKLYRYTGDFPPVDVIESFPNWDYALDEEGEEGQDETTIRPEDDQTHINEYTGFTAVDVWLASGDRCVGLAEILASEITAVNVVEHGNWWRVVFNVPEGRWKPYIETWNSRNRDAEFFKHNEVRIFPVRVETRLPMRTTGRRVRLEIRGDGTSSTE